MVSALVCLYHGNVVDPDTNKPCSVIMDYSDNYGGYWTGEDVTIQNQYTHTNFINIQPLVVFPCKSLKNQQTTTR